MLSEASNHCQFLKKVGHINTKRQIRMKVIETIGFLGISGRRIHPPPKEMSLACLRIVSQPIHPDVLQFNNYIIPGSQYTHTLTKYAMPPRHETTIINKRKRLKIREEWKQTQRLLTYKCTDACFCFQLQAHQQWHAVHNGLQLTMSYCNQLHRGLHQFPAYLTSSPVA